MKERRVARAGAVVFSAFVLAACGAEGEGPRFGFETNQRISGGARSRRIAVIGAGASGLTAAYTLESLGYDQVTIFEKESRVGGKVQTIRTPAGNIELGAVFASRDFEVVLGLAEALGIRHEPFLLPRLVLDTQGDVMTFEERLLSRFGVDEVRQATVRYAEVLERFSNLQERGFAGLDPALAVPFSEFAEAQGIEPIAEMVKPLFIGFGYGYYEQVPAAYFMKLLPWLVKVGPGGLEAPEYLIFPDGYAGLFEAMARELDVRLGSEVTGLERRPGGARGNVKLTINGGDEVWFDDVVISAPVERVAEWLEAEAPERRLFAQVRNERFVVSVLEASGLEGGRSLFIEAHTRPDTRDHVAVWSNRDPASRIFVTYQLAAWSTPSEALQATLAEDLARLGGGTVERVLARADWSYFPHVDSASFRDGFYEAFEALQGVNHTYYVGGLLSFESVEHTARYARDLMREHFDPTRVRSSLRAMH